MRLPGEIAEGLRAMGLPGEEGEPLTGGVSSDIWRVGDVCVKRALPKLKVAADWRAPVARNLYEARWLRRAGVAVPGAVPELLGQDEERGLLAMRFLAPEGHPVWKAELRDGRAVVGFAAAVGRRLAAIQGAGARDAGCAGEFPTDAIFYAIRLEPYLVAAGRAHPDLAGRLDELVTVTAGTKRALVHGDVSPKNILCGPGGPVFLDAECAWWGDPAFDLAFCLNHLLLKCLWNPAASGGFLACFDALAGAYLAGVDWEDREGVEARAAGLLAGLFLARVDGKSPAEYVTDERDKDRVRRVARRFLLAPATRVSAIRAAWAEEVSR